MCCRSLVCYVVVLTIACSEQIAPPPVAPMFMLHSDGVWKLVAYQLLFAAFGYGKRSTDYKTAGYIYSI